MRPLVWVNILLLIALFTRSTSWRKRTLWSTIAIVFLLGNTALLQVVLRCWEPSPTALVHHAEVAVVLGGYLSDRGELATDYPELSDRSDRLLHAAALYRGGHFDRLLLSGGAGGLIPGEKPEAQAAGDYLQDLGIPVSALLIEDQSRNTLENAQNSATLLQELGVDGPILLLTSAWHMPRARRCFQRAGVEIIPYPVDYLQSRHSLTFGAWIIPQAASFITWEILIKEWVGLVVYRLKGYA